VLLRQLFEVQPKAGLRHPMLPQIQHEHSVLGIARIRHSATSVGARIALALPLSPFRAPSDRHAGTSNIMCSLAGPLVVALLGLVSLVVGATPCLAAKRAALLVGNAAYRSAGALSNPLNDVKLVAAALRKAEFDIVEVKSDLGIAEFRQALRRFQSEADGAEMALIYFAGHGIEAKGVNWLIPVDAELNLDRDLEYEAIRLELALEAVAGARRRILILDACRNNPFGRKWQSGSRSLDRGLGSLEVDDVLVLFAAAPGQTASDGAGSNSPFATALAKRIAEPGLIVQLLGGRVRDDVLLATGGAQRPFVSASIGGEPFYFVSPSGAATQAKQKGASEAAEAWDRVALSTSPQVFEAFRRQYGRDNPVYDQLAVDRIAALAQEQKAEGKAKSILADKSCSLEKTAKSITAKTPTTISFRNSTESVVHIFWLDPNGERKLYASLYAGEKHTQRTFLTHPWLVTDADQRCLAVHMPQAVDRTHEIR